MKTIFQSIRNATRSTRPMLVVNNDRVDCPFAHTVSVEHCLSCPRLRDAKLDGDVRWIACSAPELSHADLLYRPVL